CHFLFPPLSLILIYILPVAIAIYLGPDAVDSFMKAMLDWIITGLKVAGGILPALGFAITITVIDRGSIIPYFLFGFFIYQYASNVNAIAFALLGLFLAYLHLTFTKNKTADNAA